MPSVTVPYREERETRGCYTHTAENPKCSCDEENKPIDIVFDVTGILTPHVPAKLNGPPEDCHPAEGGTFEITEVKPVRYYLAGEEQTADMERYRKLTGYKGEWKWMIDQDACTELALADYENERERSRRDYEEFRHDKENVWYEDGQLDDQIEREKEDKDARGYSA